MAGNHLHTRMPDTPLTTCTWLCKVLCFFNLHRWCLMCGACECCGKPDEVMHDESLGDAD